MANLTCTQCQGVFEVPPEHQSAPALGCPFCGTVVSNVHAGGGGGGGSGASTAQVDTHRPTPEVNKGPLVVVDGLQAETRKVDPNRKKKKPKKASKPDDDEELVPEADPQLAAPPPGFGGGMPQPGFGGPTGAFGGIPAPASVAGNLQGQEEEEEEDDDEDDYEDEDDYSAPGPSDYSDDYGPSDLELPEGTRLPSSGRGLLIAITLTLVVLNIIFIFAAVRNNGILKMNALGDTFSAAFGEGTKMEIAQPQPPEPDEDFDNRKPVVERPNFNVALSRPIILEDEESTVRRLAIYGFITNTTERAYQNVSFTGYINTAGGTEMSESLRSAVLPSELATGTATTAIEALKNKRSRSDINAWFAEIRTKAENTKLTPHTPMPFLLVFDNSPEEITVDYLFGIKDIEYSLGE